MKKILFIFTLLLSVCAIAQIEEVIPSRPSPPRLVNDFTNTLTEAQKKALEDKLVAYDDSTSNQVAVIIIPTTGNYSVEEVALEILRRWGVGNKARNNGIVFLIAKDDRKLRIEVGYGLEGAIPDITASSIIDNDITPNFKEGSYYRGIDEGTDAIIKAAAGEYQAPANYGSKKKKGLSAGTILIILIVLFIIFGGAAPGGGTYVSRGGFGGWTGGSGRSGGGGWSGGGSSGGFGGFGGGSGGGGGSSGSW
ncbi:MAG: TPM domain-containing protein [Chitinophagaceae bacterium]|nr:TPM domain-containing protein [Chitinophagaceae bacterium]MBP6234110.1 TPM domain-containing protein [Chitinophagaceae bacterium]